MWTSARGAALIDLIATCAIVAIFSAMVIPTVFANRDRDRARLAARYLAQRLHVLRGEALRRNQAVALRFEPRDRNLTRAYVDGDGDGVQQRDIDGGVDPPLGGEERLSDMFAGVVLRIAADVPLPDGGGVVAADSDPVRIGSNLLSFSPLATATSGTIYLVSGTSPQMCVRVFGATGRIRVLWFDRASGTWRQD